MPRGGRRIGAGRKPKSALEHAIGGNAGRRRHSATVLQHPSASSTAVAPIVLFDPPKDLPAEALVIWKELAPHAFTARTLTPATVAAFVMLCRAVVRERALSLSPIDCGGANHRGLMQRVGAWMKDFAIAPFGKALYGSDKAEAPTSKLDRFLKKSR